MTATIYFSEMLDILDDRLLDLMFEFFFGYFENPETEDEVSEYISRSKIIKRIESESESVPFFFLHSQNSYFSLNNIVMFEYIKIL